MAVSGLPTDAGVGILTSALKSDVKKFVLYGTSGSGDVVPFDEGSTVSSLAGYAVGKFEVSRAYFDDNGSLTFECPLPYEFSSVKWVGACGLVHVDASNGGETLVALSTMPRFQKTEGIGGVIHYKVPIAGSSGSVVFEDKPYITQEALDTVMNEQYTLSMEALSLAGMANRELEKTLKQRVQSGEVLIKNRGIIKGCVASKSSSATRNLNISSGAVFMNGQILSLAEMMNTANVPSNSADVAKSCYAYLWFDSANAAQVDCTGFDESVPDDGVVLYKISIPAHSTEASDPHLDGCTLSDRRVIEASYPKMVLNAPFTYVALPFALQDSEYSVDLDVVEFDGSGFGMGCIYVGSRAKNGFGVYMNGTVDSVKVRWTIKSLSL